MTDRERREAAREARAAFRAVVERAKAENAIYRELADATLATIDNADSLATALSAVEAERDGLAAKITELEAALDKALRFLDYASDHGGGDARHIDGNGVVIAASLSGCPSCFARDAATFIRTLSVSPAGVREDPK